DDDRLPHDLERALLGRRTPGGDLVREGRPLLDRPAPVRAHLQCRDPAALGGEDRLGRLPCDRRRVLAARGDPPRRPPRPRRRAAPARLGRRDRPAARRGARLAGGRVRAGARQDDAEAGRRRARLPRGRREARSARAAARGARDREQGRELEAGRGGGRACRSERHRPGRPRGRAAVARAGRIRVRGDPRALGDDERAARARGIPVARSSDRRAARRPRRAAGRRSDHARRRAGAAAHGDHLAGVVGDRGARPPLRPVHDQRRAAQALAHPLGPTALLSRPRLDARARGGLARLPAAARLRPPLRRPGLGRPGAQGADPQLPDAALEVVDPLRVPGQPAHADPLPRRLDALDEPRGRRDARHPRQRLGRGLQPQRRRHRPRRRHPPRPAGRLPDVPRQGPPPEHAEDRAARQPRRHRQLRDADHDEADAPCRRLRPALLRLQLLRADRLTAGRDHRRAQAPTGARVLMRVRAQVAMVMNLDKCIGCHTCSVTCKQVWTNRPGTEYVWFNNVETKPGLGYPRTYEDNDKWRGGWELDRKGRLRLKAGGRLEKILKIFWNPNLPTIDDYYEPWTYDYQTLIDAPLSEHDPVARPFSQLTGDPIEVRRGPNWDDNLAGAPEHAHADPLLRGIEEQVTFAYEQAFMFYLPRICEHCLNPSCVASCPSGAMYKRVEDGIVLVDQDKCRGWRFCVSGCPYKKVYFNHRSGKAEKCTLCYPRIEAGQPTICSETCVGRIRYLGLLLYDADRVEAAASVADEHDLLGAQLGLFLDPNDPEVAARAL